MKHKKINFKVYCKRCDNKVVKSNNPEYTYQCFDCEEDLYTIETYKKETE